MIKVMAKYCLHQISSLATELLAIYEACVFDIECGFTNGIVELDCQLAVSLIYDNMDHLQEECFILESIRALFHHFSRFVYSFIPRSTNVAAHVVAQFAFNYFSNIVWLEMGPMWLSDILSSDVLCSLF